VKCDLKNARGFAGVRRKKGRNTGEYFLEKQEKKVLSPPDTLIKKNQGFASP
jgi:hypothetical protein